jgi:hypothetical protein
MKRLLLVYDDKDFAEWVEEELAEYGRFIRSFESLDFFFPQWNAAGSIDVIILPEAVIKTEESFENIYRTVKNESPETVFLLIYQRDKDHLVDMLISEGNVCVNYDELDAGLLEERLKNNKNPILPKAEVRYENVKVATAIEEPNVTNQKSELNLHSDEKNFDRKSVVEQIYPITQIPESNFSNQVNVPNHNIAIPMKQEQSNEIEQVVIPLKKQKSTEEQKAKLQRIKERIIIEEKIVTVHVPVHFNSKLVSIVSLYPRAGATFITSNFARMLGENKVPVAVVEPVLNSVGSTHYELMHGEKNAPKEWKSWSEQIQSNGYIAKESNWSSGGVNWIPSNIEPILNWTDEQTMQLLLAANRFPVTLCDISSNYNEDMSKKILSMSDEIWIVTDGDPIQLSHHYKVIDNFKNEYPGKPMKAIGNKWNSYIKQSEWKEAILIPVLTHIPDLGSIVIKQLWDGKMAWDNEKLKNTLSSPFKPMARSVVAKEMFSIIKTQYGFKAKLSGLIRKMKSLEDESKTRKF